MKRVNKHVFIALDLGQKVGCSGSGPWFAYQQGILSVEKQQPKEDEEKGVSQGKKTVFISS